MNPSASVLLSRLQSKVRLRHLQVLVKLGELHNIKRCAEALGLSQPAVTQLLADLERLVDLPLFERHSRGVRITAAGAELLPLARRMLDALAEGSEALTAMKREGEGVVRVAALISAVSGLLAQALPAFVRAHPAIQVHVRDVDADQWALALARREADVAVCRQAASAPAGHVFRPLLEDRFVVACGPRHPLAGRRRVPWDRLLREAWLPAPAGTAARREFDAQASAAGVEPRLCHVVTRAPLLTCAMLQADRLLTLVPFGVVRTFVQSGQLAVIEPVPALPFAPIGLMLPQSGGTVATRVFADFLTRFVAGPADAASAGGN